MFPIRDHNPSRSAPVVTVALIAANVGIYLVTAGSLNDPRFLAEWSLIPALSAPVTFLTSQFLHGGILHLVGNMLFLWIFGDNLEDLMGRLGFLAFYLISGVAAAMAQVVPDPGSTIPMVGASGAIAGVMGGYLLLFPRARVDVLLIFIVFFKVVPIRAWAVLAIWFAVQMVSGLLAPAGTGGVAYWAHAGGFAAGIVMSVPLWLRLGGPSFWARAGGVPSHPRVVRRARPVRPDRDIWVAPKGPPIVARPSPIPKAGRKRRGHTPFRPRDR